MTTQEKLHTISTQLNDFFVERDEEIHGLLLAGLTGSNIIFLGSPGIAKSLLITSFSKLMGNAKIFKKLVNKYTIPEELFGPFKIAELRNNVFERNIEDTLVDADIGFLDEVFKANSGILNALLDIMNEREFRNGTKILKVPLKFLAGASNEIPEEDDGLAAMYDRFLLKFMSNPIIEDSNFLQMINSTVPNYTPIISMDELRAVQKDINAVTMSAEIGALFNALRNKLRSEGLAATDRTYRNSINILKAEAYLNDRNFIDSQDFEVLKHVLWTDPDKRRQVYSLILEIANPIMKEIEELYDEALTMQSEYTAKSQANKGKKGNKDDVNLTGLDVAAKMSNISQKISVKMKLMNDAKMNITKVKKILNHIDQLRRGIIGDITSMDGFFETFKQKP